MNFLQTLVEGKQTEIAMLREQSESLMVAARGKATPMISVDTLFPLGGMTLIAELKRASPSKGMINAGCDLTHQAHIYQQAGVKVISVLTEQSYFKGSPEILDALTAEFDETGVVFLRKDFIVDPLQLYQTVLLGAKVVLLIAAVLGERLSEFVTLAKVLGLQPLVEVHTKAECELAKASGANLIGINNRNLSDFTVSLDTSLTLSREFDQHDCLVAESGITERSQVSMLQAAGFRAILVGEHLMRADSPAKAIAELLS